MCVCVCVCVCGVCLSQAAYNGHVKCVEALLSAGADVHAIDHKLGRSALHWAAHKGHEAAVEALLYAGADAEAAERELQLTPLHLAVKAGCVFVVQAKGAETQRMRRSLQRCVAYPSVTGDCGRADGSWAWVLRRSVRHVAAVRAILYARSDRFLAPGRSLPGPSPLHWACAYGRASVLAVLVSSTLGPDVFEREAAAGGTPLHAACFAGRCGLSHHSSPPKGDDDSCASSRSR